MLSVVYAECRYADCHGAIKKCLAKKVSLSEKLLNIHDQKSSQNIIQKVFLNIIDR
jgi:hypothetical protein